MLLRASRRAVQDPDLLAVPRAQLLVCTTEPLQPPTDALLALRQALPPTGPCLFRAPGQAAAEAEFLLALFLSPAQLDSLYDQMLAARRAGRSCTLVVAQRPQELLAFGRWLEQRAQGGRLQGLRLIVASDIAAVAEQLPQRLAHPTQDNLLRMPLMPEIENGPLRNFYLFSPELQAVVGRLRAFAENGIQRVCLLGGPGSGKTTLAYYFYLARGRGQFVAVNLLAENTRDKAAIKSLLCGHVAGAFPGAGARTGAFTQARDGVCFIDESHDISGPVMEVLMEAFDNGQYLPYGANSKRQVECAIAFATNRSWDYLQKAVNLDEFTRLGAAIVQLPPLAVREEDLIGLTASLLARLGEQCRSWSAPEGFDAEAWALLRNQRWRGNLRGLARVVEASFVETAARGGKNLIGAEAVVDALRLWEPDQHHSHALYEPAPTGT